MSKNCVWLLQGVVNSLSSSGRPKFDMESTIRMQVNMRQRTFLRTHNNIFRQDRCANFHDIPENVYLIEIIVFHNDVDM